MTAGQMQTSISFPKPQRNNLKFACFTSTQVQILTLTRLPGENTGNDCRGDASNHLIPAAAARPRVRALLVQKYLLYFHY
jgi:hypothetical protein